MAHLSKQRSREYWRENVRIICVYLLLWATTSLGCGVIFVEPLNSIEFMGVQLGFWFAQQGAIYLFLIMMVGYAVSMNKLDEKYKVDDDA